MKIRYDYLNDTTFLKELAGLHIRQYFVKITILNWKEDPIQEIQGRVTSANMNIDGQSSIRRTANLSLVVDELINNITNVDNLLSINKKVNMEIGYINTTGKYAKYPILWFPLGIYVIITSSISHSDSGLAVSLQLKDKMCLLNGECGGTLPASVVFDNYDTIDENGNWIISRPPIYQIIRELVNHFGGEQLGKIIISDLDTRVKQVMKWTSNSPLYFLKKQDQYIMTINPSDYQSAVAEGFVDIEGSPFEYGEDVGYIFTNFTFPGDLIGDAGNTVTDILDKILEVLGNYEYFYDIDGNFVFQQIKNYLNNAQSKYILDSLNARQLLPDYIDAQNDPYIQAYLIDTSSGTSVFQFNDSNLITSYNNNPQYSMIKNDYMVWGIRKTSQGYEMPIRYHLVIDKKPIPGNTYQAFSYVDPDDGLTKWHCPIKFASKNNFPTTGAAGVFYMDKSTGLIYKWQSSNTEHGYVVVATKLENITTTDWRTELYFQGITAEPFGTESNYYYSELLNEWPKIYNIEPDTIVDGKTVNNSSLKKQVINNPSGIDFYLDFIDSSSQVSEFSVDNIGRRTKVLNEGTNVNCIFQAWIPDVVLINSDYSGPDEKSAPAALREECEKRGQAYYQVSGQIYDALSMGGTLNSAYEIVRQLIHEYTSYNETISLQTLPIYHLEPNTRITVRDAQSGIFGDYMINSMTFALDNQGILTINASRALEKI